MLVVLESLQDTEIALKIKYIIKRMNKMVDFKELDEEEFNNDVEAFVSMGFSQEVAEQLAQTAKLMKSISELTPDNELSNVKKVEDAIYDNAIVIDNAFKKPLKMIEKDFQKFLNNLYPRLENEYVIEKLSDMMSHRISEYNYSPKEIIEYLKDEWDCLTKEEQQKLGVLIVGRNQLNKFLVLMHDYDEIMNKEEKNITDEISDSHDEVENDYVGQFSDIMKYILINTQKYDESNEYLKELKEHLVEMKSAWEELRKDMNEYVKNELIKEVKKFPLWLAAEVNKVDTNYSNTAKSLADSIVKSVHGTGLNTNNNNFNQGDNLTIDDSYIVRVTSEQVMIYKRLH